MINAEQIYQKAQSLDVMMLQELSMFLDSLLDKKSVSCKSIAIFPETQLESADTDSVYQGHPLTLGDMEQAIEWEARQVS